MNYLTKIIIAKSLLMPNLKNLIGKLLSRSKQVDEKLNENKARAYNSFIRLYGPFGIDYSTLKEKGTLQ